MATNGRLSDKQVVAWFGELDFDRQASLLDSLSGMHQEAKSTRINELRRELAALENGNTNGTSKSTKSSKRKRNGKVKLAGVKYRDPATGDTWAGRGRMASWLAAKQKAGEKIAKYLVK